MYSAADHWKMMADHVRGDAYEEALRRSVKPGVTVLDIGTGTGIFALLACVFGAGRVYAIEYDDSIQVAKSLAASNGLAGRIEFIQGFSTDVTLPERVDVIVSDLRGVLPLHGRHLPSIEDARRRFLAPGGVLIPQRDMIWAAPVEAPELYHQLVAPWERDPHGLDFETARLLAANRWSKVRLRSQELLAPPQLWTTLEYEQVESPDVSGELTFVVARPGTAHGWCVWFDSTVIEGVSFSSAPGAPELIYGNGFFPLLHPVQLAAGDHVSLTLSANLVGGDYVWRWATRLYGESEDGKPRAEFLQSNFIGASISSSTLRRGSLAPSVAGGEGRARQADPPPGEP